MVQYPIPGNDDAIRSAALLTRVIADACADGLMLRASRSPDEDLQIAAMEAASAEGSGLDTSEPKAAWELELERQQAAEQASAATGEEVASEEEPTPADDATDAAEPVDAEQGTTGEGA
jgi:small subunit ribosomal protein S2